MKGCQQWLNYISKGFLDLIQIIRLILEDMWLSLRDCLRRFQAAMWFALTILGIDWTPFLSN